MGHKAEEIPKGFLKSVFPGPYTYEKRCQHRLQRRRMKRDPEYAPQYNRYQGWAT